ncbi:DUF1772 domain-containing protein [Rhodoblastus acidophilus]|uniref:DUF1772 domain-containing protein n=1 Tax=Rhodoblastus acidophilus TaxID=1074 RepID=A0A6N8DKX0_RHOAC|nr:DUF1772 domain-containing protein [Rhodoblastus acidophilus]MCW2272457.1 putative membrane protein [Rhodoblastus acidophilus]MTV29374.1 DUF1772 domain-containing protein [Rhodoblastus acidophilus]
MLAGLLAFAFAAAFTGAALYIALVEQPARLALDDTSMMREWAPSDRRGFALLGGLALAAAVAALAAFGQASDIRWLVGALIAATSWPYFYFIVVPINNRLLAQAQPQADSRELVRDWGWLEWGLVVIGLAASAVFGWILA